jgi:hypothetical protein
MTGCGWVFGEGLSRYKYINETNKLTKQKSINERWKEKMFRKGMKKKLLAVLLVFVLLFGQIGAATALVAETEITPHSQLDRVHWTADHVYLPEGQNYFDLVVRLNWALTPPVAIADMIPFGVDIPTGAFTFGQGTVGPVVIGTVTEQFHGPPVDGRTPIPFDVVLTNHVVGQEIEITIRVNLAATTIPNVGDSEVINLHRGAMAEGSWEHTYFAVNVTRIARPTVTFDPNNGVFTGPTQLPTRDVIIGGLYGQAIDALGNLVNPELPRPTRVSHEFAGWWTTPAVGGTQITSTTEVTIATSHTLYARWTANEIQLTFDPNSGEFTGPTQSPTRTVLFGGLYGQAIDAQGNLLNPNLPRPTRVSHEFAGWWTTPAVGGTQITATTEVTIATGHTLYARWDANDVVVTFDANHGDPSATVPQSITFGHTYAAAMELPAVVALTERVGFNFVGWFTTPAVGGEQVHPTTVMDNPLPHTLYARWEAQVFSIWLVNNGPEGCPSTPNESLAAARLIRMWPELDGVVAHPDNDPIPASYADTIVATVRSNNDCALTLGILRVNLRWDEATGVFDPIIVNIDADTTINWEFIDFEITVFGQRVTAVLHNPYFCDCGLCDCDMCDVECTLCEDCGECPRCDGHLEFRWDAFNNGVGPGAYPSRPNPELAQLGTIRLWTGFGPIPATLEEQDRYNRPIPFRVVGAVDQDNNNAMQFVTNDSMWDQWGYMNLVDVDKANGAWEYIWLTIEVCDHRNPNPPYRGPYRALLINDRFVPFTVRFTFYTDQTELLQDGLHIDVPVIPGAPRATWPDQAALAAALSRGNIYGAPNAPGHAFWGWFDAPTLNASNRTRLTPLGDMRRPALADTCMLEVLLSSIENATTTAEISAIFNNAHGGTFEIFAIWSLWGDVDDNDIVNAADLNLLRLYVTFGEIVPLNLRAANVVVDGHVNAADLNLLRLYVTFGNLLPTVLGRPPQP